MKLNISGKIILIAVAGVIASSLVILSLSTMLMRRLLDYTIQKEMTAMQSLIARIQQQDQMRLFHDIQLLISMPDLVDAVQRSDTDGILQNKQLAWLRRDIDIITFTDSNGIAIARSHSYRTGDDISGSKVMQSTLKGNVSSGVFFDDTTMIPYSMRCFAPIYKDGVLVGTLSLGTDICTEKYVDNLYKLTGVHYSFYKNDITLMTSLMDDDGRRFNGTKLRNTYVTDAVLNRGESVIVQRDILGDPYMVMHWAIKDYYGEIVGMWAAAMPLERQTRETNRVLWLIIFCSLGIISVFALAASIIGNRISIPVRKITEFAVHVANGNLDDQITVKSRDEVGQLAGALNSMVTTLKDRINEAEEQHAAAVAANKAKSTFLSTMSHEIRTPMNAIIGITEIQLRHEDLSENVMDAFEKIYNSGDMLMSIINDILDLSKIEAGKLDLMEKNYEFASMISDTAHLNMMKIGSKRIEFEMDVDKNIPFNLLGDELRVKQILNNILSNAFKYTASGKVTMSVALDNKNTNAAAEEASGKITLVFTISDTGQGMTKEQIEKLYDEYARFNQEANRATEGTGLGMNITRNLIDMMNGKIHVESEVGKGTVFNIYLPQGKVDSAVIGSEMAENLSKFRMHNRSYLKNIQISLEPMPYGRILIVDDIDTNIYVAKGLMLPYELKEIDSANSGIEAIKKIKEGNVYDVVFMDHMMPGMDGIETVKHMREAGYKEPIVALTANAVGGQAEIFIQNNFNDFISKPIDMRQLNVIMNTYVRDKQPQEVIDEVHRQMQLKQNAQKKDKPAAGKYTVQVAEQIAQQNAEQSAPDSLLFGVEIPGMDVAKGLKRFDGNEKVYLDVLRSYAAGVSSMLDKIETFSGETLADYVIKVHGIKGTSFDVFAEQVAKEAKDLEEAGKSGDLEFIKANHSSFMESARNLVFGIEEMLKNLDLESRKPLKDKPDIKILLKLINACKDFDMDGADEAIAELEEYKYESDNDLIHWLRDCIDRMQFEEIIEKLSPAAC
ncbi:MAG: response regulator [Treponema sp.]|jgi:signal transduction histidine kinase/CheY-like chemotaxis protein|nr:response regulator [Treponema sp.]